MNITEEPESTEELVSQIFQEEFVQPNDEKTALYVSSGGKLKCACRIITLICVIAINTALLIFSLRNYQCMLDDVQGMDIQDGSVVLLVGSSEIVGVSPITITDGSGCKVEKQGFELTPSNPTLVSINENQDSLSITATDDDQIGAYQISMKACLEYNPSVCTYGEPSTISIKPLF